MPAKKSTQHHLIAGTFRSDRHLQSRLLFAPASATPPRYLPKVAKQEWNRIAPALLERGLLMETDVSLLGLYCTAYAGYRECADIVATEGQTVLFETSTRTGKSVKRIKNPAATLMQEHGRTMLAVAARFGFSPKDRELIDGTDAPELPDDSTQAVITPSSALHARGDAPNTHGDALGSFIKFPSSVRTANG